jgi:hypothetical protein
MDDVMFKCDYQLDAYAADIAAEIAEEIKEHGGDAASLAHERADGSEHVIYHYKAHAICQNCNVAAGEDFVSCMGEPRGGWSYNGFAVAIAYGELRHRIECALADKGVI